MIKYGNILKLSEEEKKMNKDCLNTTYITTFTKRLLKAKCSGINCRDCIVGINSRYWGNKIGCDENILDFLNSELNEKIIIK